MEEEQENVVKVNWAIKLCVPNHCVTILHWNPRRETNFMPEWRYETTFVVPCGPVHPSVCFEATRWRPSVVHRSGRDHNWSPAPHRLSCEVACDATSAYVCVGAHSVRACDFRCAYGHACMSMCARMSRCVPMSVWQGAMHIHTYIYIYEDSTCLDKHNI